MSPQLASFPDRRLAVRFPLDREVQFRIARRKDRFGAGRTIDISSAGVRFTTNCELFAGERVELSIDWPAQLDNGVLLKLVVTGRVVRCDGVCAAIETTAYEFRTSRRTIWSVAQAGGAEARPPAAAD